MSDYRALGGEPALRRIVEDFVGRMFDDFIIGFLFEGKDRLHLVERELEHAARHLGGPHRYTGRPIAAVHRPLRINRGQFRRRLALLRTVLDHHGVDPNIADRWIAHDRRLEAVITDGTDCAPEG